MKTIIRNILRNLYRSLIYVDAIINDKKYITQPIPKPKLVNHISKEDYILDNFDRPGLRILEIGAREVTGKGKLRDRLRAATYVGFDLYAGKNVDIIGDAHYLSSYFPRQFDVVYSSACFEHFAMPWLVAQEIARILKVSGHLIVETHFSYRMHERPWNFFQFSDAGLKILFNELLGFECIDSGMSNPIIGRFSVCADEYLRLRPIGDMYCHSIFVGIKRFDNPDFEWSADNYKKIIKGTRYPTPKTL